jgi:hypothetical protein
MPSLLETPLVCANCINAGADIGAIPAAINWLVSIPIVLGAALFAQPTWGCDLKSLSYVNVTVR